MKTKLSIVKFALKHYRALKKFKEVVEITGRYDEEWWTYKSVMHYKDNYGVFYMGSCHPAQAIVDQITVDQGRFINQIDIDRVRKTAAIDHFVKDALVE